MNELKTCFKKVDYDLSGLLNYIEIGDIGLPDIQRPFVWTNAKVRDLFDSEFSCRGRRSFVRFCKGMGSNLYFEQRMCNEIEGDMGIGSLT